jgi:hypothetical protein
VCAVESLPFQALVHHLKAAAWPSAPDAPHWKAKAQGFRAQASLRFARSMRQRIDVARLYAKALRVLPDTIGGQPPLPVPGDCPITPEEMLAET